MDKYQILAPDEEKLLTALGYLVMRWNYAEGFARGILRKNFPEGSLADVNHMKISSRSAGGIESDLQKLALPNWQNPGRPFLERLIDVFSSGREFRNSIVHGIYFTVPQRGEWPARAVLTFEKPRGGKVHLLPDIELEKLIETANYFHDLAMFAREVSLTFDMKGAVATNNDGSPVMLKFPTMIVPLSGIERIEI